jgi:iron complex outermembrane receptor protein
MKKTPLSFYTAAVVAAAVSAPALAQNLTLEEIVVTATKRTEGLQEVPIAISVMGGKDITEKGLTKMEDLAMYMPNVHVSEASAGTQLFIRGIGSGVNYGFEQSVGTFVDGVYFGRGRSARGKFLDIERVEVLKGPQSTLFGKNTIAGALNITTGQPTEEFEGYVSAGYTSELDAMTITTVVSGPLSDKVRGRLAVRSYEDDGYVDNPAPAGADAPQTDSTYIRGTLAIDLNDDWTATIKAEHGNYDVIGRQEVLSDVGHTTGASLPLALQPSAAALVGSSALYGSPLGATNFEPGFGYTTYEQNVRDLPLFDDTESTILQLTLDGTIAGHGIKAVIAGTEYDFTNSLDTDYSPLKLLNRGRTEEHEQFSAELVVSSPTGGAFEYLAGAFYQTEELSNNRYTHIDLSAVAPLQNGVFGLLNASAFRFVLPGGSTDPLVAGALTTADHNGALDATARSFFDQDADSWSVFAEGTFNVSDTFRVTAGLRYSEDEKSMAKSGAVAYYDPDAASAILPAPLLANIYALGLNLAATHSYTRDRKEDHVTGHVNFQWDMTNDAMVYLELGNGYKAGGFDEDNGMGREVEEVSAGVFDDLADFEDESVETIEIGAKINLQDGRGRLNIAAFSSTYDDVQVSTFDGNAAFVVGNAAESEVKGVEADVMYRLTEELTLNGAFAYLDATYKSFPNAGCNIEQTLLHRASGDAGGCVQDLSGEQLQFAPEYTANLGIAYETALTASLVLSAGLDYNWSDDVVVAADMDAKMIQQSFGKLNGRIALAGNDQWQISLVGKNLTDEETFMWGNDVPLGSLGFNRTNFKMIDPPRTFELSGRINF